MKETRKLWVGSLVLECKEFHKMIAFWKAALGYQEVSPPTDDWVILHDPSSKGPNLSLQKVAEAPGEDYRFHFDLYSSDPEQEIIRLIGLGAKLREPLQAERDFATLEDPDGNPFDVVVKKEFSYGQRT